MVVRKKAVDSDVYGEDASADPVIGVGGNSKIGRRAQRLAQLRVVPRLDPMAERIRQQIEQLMKANGNMHQKTLAKRAKVSQGRVHRFITGQMPYPPLTFLHSLLGVFGYTLPEALTAMSLPAKQLPQPAISNPIVLELASAIEDWPDEAVKNLLVALRGMRPARQKKVRSPR